MSAGNIGREIDKKLFDKAESVISFGPDGHASEDILRSSCEHLFNKMRLYEIFVLMVDGSRHWNITNFDTLVGLLSPKVRIRYIVKISSFELDRIIPDRG